MSKAAPMFIDELGKVEAVETVDGKWHIYDVQDDAPLAHIANQTNAGIIAKRLAACWNLHEDQPLFAEPDDD